MTSCYLQILVWLLFWGLKNRWWSQCSAHCYMPAICCSTVHYACVCEWALVDVTVKSKIRMKVSQFNWPFVFICLQACANKHVLPPAVRMMMVSDDCLVECKIDDDSDGDEGGGEQMNTPPPPPEFASKASTPAPKPPTPPTVPATPTPTHPVSRDPYGINKHLKVYIVCHGSDTVCTWMSESQVFFNCIFKCRTFFVMEYFYFNVLELLSTSSTRT